MVRRDHPVLFVRSHNRSPCGMLALPFGNELDDCTNLLLTVVLRVGYRVRCGTTASNGPRGPSTTARSATLGCSTPPGTGSDRVSTSVRGQRHSTATP